MLAHLLEFKNHAPRVLRKARGALGITLTIGYSPKALGHFSLFHAYPCVWAQEMSLSFGAPKQPKTSIR
ncbi:unnamed protein product [Prunus armeniaca]